MNSKWNIFKFFITFLSQFRQFSVQIGYLGKEFINFFTFLCLFTLNYRNFWGILVFLSHNLRIFVLSIILKIFHCASCDTNTDCGTEKRYNWRIIYGHPWTNPLVAKVIYFSSKLNSMIGISPSLQTFLSIQFFFARRFLYLPIICKLSRLPIFQMQWPRNWWVEIKRDPI